MQLHPKVKRFFRRLDFLLHGSPERKKQFNIQIIREYRPTRTTTEGHIIPGRAVMRTNTYASSAAFIEWLTENALREFPGLNPDDIEVEYYAGSVVLPGTFGIEFNPPFVPGKEFRTIREIEFTY